MSEALSKAEKALYLSRTPSGSADTADGSITLVVYKFKKKNLILDSFTQNVLHHKNKKLCSLTKSLLMMKDQKSREEVQR